MKYPCAILCCVLLLVGAGRAPVGANAPASTATRAGRLAVFDDVWATVGVRYYDPAFGGVDWQAWGASLRPVAADAPTQDELYAVLRRLVATLRDPHTRVYAPGEYTDWQRPRYLSAGVSLRELAGALVVTRVEPDSTAARAGVRAGDELRSVDGEGAAALLARRVSELARDPADAAARRAAVARLFDGPLAAPVNAVFADARGRTLEVQLRRAWAERAPALAVRREGAYAVVSFNLFTEEIALALLRALRTDLRRARGLVIDLRENGGGDAEAMTDLASAFLPAGTSLGQFTDRTGRLSAAPQTRAAPLLAAERIEQFDAPVVLLTSARTASAAEIFVAALRGGGRARTVGEQTCGCVLGIRRRHTLPDGGALDLSELDYHTARGTRLERAGLAPDDAIAPTRADLSTGRDPALTRALVVLNLNR
ncbi:MAG TPA: S41 family peptidase [Pyrinomonadaceae bacterium]|jgi:carboxyl-terminal processing protease